MKREQKSGRGLIGRRVLLGGDVWTVKRVQSNGDLTIHHERNNRDWWTTVPRRQVRFIRRKMEPRLNARERQALEAGFRELRTRS